VREYVLLLLFITGPICFSKEKSACHPESILGEVSSYELIGGHLKERRSWHKLPKEVSLHTGEFGRLKFSEGHSVRLTYDGKSYKKILTKKLDQSFIADINFVKWFDDVHTFKGGTLKFELLKLQKKNKKIKKKDNHRVICSYNMEITGGD